MPDFGNAIEKVSYTHDAMIDLLIARPHVSQADVARHFGFTQSWISRVIRSDAFRERLATRKKELVDPVILESIETGFEALVSQSLEILRNKLDTDPSADLALKAAELGARAIGYGARPTLAINNVQQNFVVHVPAKARSADEWLADRSTPAAQGAAQARFDQAAQARLIEGAAQAPATQGVAQAILTIEQTGTDD
jgi:hypothetical protein